MNREEWLTTFLHTHLYARLSVWGGADVPRDCKVSMGFPGGGSARKRIGECWPRARSKDGVNEIFINPAVLDTFRIVEILAHEAIHASDDCKSGHKGHFRKVALAIGLEGKMTATVAGAQLRAWIESAIASMPPFPHGALSLDGRKKQATRMLKVVCSRCGCTVRMTQKWVSEVGYPTCACGGAMGGA